MTYFLLQLIAAAVSWAPLLIVGVVAMIVGLCGVEFCLYIGLGLMALYVLICLVVAWQRKRIMQRLSEEDPEFARMMENLTGDPRAFLSDIMEGQEEHKAMHGEELLTLSDEDLFETVYLQNLDIAEKGHEDDTELEQFTGARKNVYILSIWDAEIQNGGLCQFFVNSSRTAAPFVSDVLALVGATEHKALFDRFVEQNGIDLCDLDSFKVRSTRGFVKQTKRYDFDAFDDAYYELPPLEDYVVSYIKANIQEF